LNKSKKSAEVRENNREHYSLSIPVKKGGFWAKTYYKKVFKGGPQRHLTAPMESVKGGDRKYQLTLLQEKNWT